MKLQLVKVGVFFVYRIDVFALKGSVRRLSLNPHHLFDGDFFCFYFFRKNKIKFSPNRVVKPACVLTLREYGSYVGVPIAIGSRRLSL